MFWVVERNFLSSWLTWYRKGKRPHLQCRQLTKCQKVGLRSHDFVALPLETRHECDEDQIWKIEEKSEKCSFLGGLYWWKADFTVFKNHSKCRIWIFVFSTKQYGPIKIDISGNTVWLQASGFQKLVKMDYFLMSTLSCPNVNATRFARNIK